MLQTNAGLLLGHFLYLSHQPLLDAGRNLCFQINVYIAAFAPDADETSDTQPSKFPKTDVLSHIEVADGRIWLLQEAIEFFAGDSSEQEKKLVWATQCVPAPDLFAAKAGGTAWRSKLSWYIVAKNDRTIQPDCGKYEIAKCRGEKR